MWQPTSWDPTGEAKSANLGWYRVILSEKLSQKLVTSARLHRSSLSVISASRFALGNTFIIKDSPLDLTELELYSCKPFLMDQRTSAYD